MEGSLPITSIQGTTYLSQQKIRVVATRILTMLCISIVLSGLLHIATRLLPYNRIVVFNQPTSTAVHMASVRIAKPGFVIIYMQSEGGWEQVGSSWYLTPGYYKDLVIDIGTHEIISQENKDLVDGNYSPKNFVARMVIDSGTPYFIDDDLRDEPVRNRYGNLYQKRFWFEARGNRLKQFAVWLMDDPLGHGFDALWPY